MPTATRTTADEAAIIDAQLMADPLIRAALADHTQDPFVIQDIRAVDDAGGEHYETRFTGSAITHMVDNGLLRLEGNIRPDHMPGQHLSAKTRRKIEHWANDLNANNAVMGNLSFRLNPATTRYAIVPDEDGDPQLVLYKGYLDTAVDSESRLKAILLAMRSPARMMKPATRFAVRIWIGDDPTAKRVAAAYNTQGEKVNDTAAKFAYQATRELELARGLMRHSLHLGLDNVEVLKNTVSANSSKLVAFNTLAQAVETSWEGEMVTEDDVERQAEFLARFWDALVAARPEYGRRTKSQRQANRGNSVSGTAVSIHGLIGVASIMYKHGLDPQTILPKLAAPVTDAGTSMDYFSYDNPLWVNLGVLALAPTKDGTKINKQLRMSFQTRQAMVAELVRKLELPSK